MVNNKEFAKRLKEVMDFHQLSATSFADQIDVQRSSISHILSGRNKPSLDFVLKVTNRFNDVDIFWLLNGKGHFPKTKDHNLAPTPSNSLQTGISAGTHSVTGKSIQRIVVFYEDGTFEEFSK